MEVAVTGAERRARLAATRVYLVVTEAACRGPWEAAVERALSSGAVGAVQLREKALPDDAFLARAERLLRLARAAGALFLANDRVALVGPSGADGVHVGEDDAPPEEARRVLGPDLLVGVSAHDRGELALAEARGADYAGLGPCFDTATKRLSRRPGGPDLVRACAGATRLPWFPIGGITPANAAALAAAGASRVAVGAGVLAAPDPAAAAVALRAALEPRG